MDLDLVTERFHENFTAYGEIGASVSVWQHGEEILRLAGGHCDRERTQPWKENTRVLFWSATKGLAAGSVLHACQEYGVPLTSKVSEVWPEFAAGGKENVTLAELLSHQAGLSALSEQVSVHDYAAVIAALAVETPHWPPGTAHAYHPRTFGFLMDEVLRRVTRGTPLGEYWRTHLAEPMELDLWIGLPGGLADEVAPVFAARSPLPKDNPFYGALAQPTSLTARAFTSPRGLHSVSSVNTRETRTGSYPAFGGIGTASSLGKYYAVLANGGTHGGQRYFEPQTLGWMSTTLTQGFDHVLQIETAFSAGFMKDPMGPSGHKQRMLFGPNESAFGHPGAGGSLAFADPERGIAFAYVMNQMEPGVLPNAKSLRLVEALYC